MQGAHGFATRILSAALVIIGLVMIVITAAGGGGIGAAGYLFGVLFTAAGALRLYAASRSAR